MNFGYARVSTTNYWKIKSSYLNKQEQRKIFKEKISGTTTNRPEFRKLLNILQTEDTLIITKLDWLARNTRESLEIIQNLFE